MRTGSLTGCEEVLGIVDCSHNPAGPLFKREMRKMVLSRVQQKRSGLHQAGLLRIGFSLLNGGSSSKKKLNQPAKIGQILITIYGQILIDNSMSS